MGGRGVASLMARELMERRIDPCEVPRVAYAHETHKSCARCATPGAGRALERGANLLARRGAGACRLREALEGAAHPGSGGEWALGRRSFRDAARPNGAAAGTKRTSCISLTRRSGSRSFGNAAA